MNKTNKEHNSPVWFVKHAECTVLCDATHTSLVVGQFGAKKVNERSKGNK